MAKSWLKSLSEKLTRRPLHRRHRVTQVSSAAAVEMLEYRRMLSADAMTTNVVVPGYGGVTAATLTANTTGVITMTPSTMQAAYGVTSLLSAGTNGTGETIAIIDAYNDPNIVSDANAFSSYYGLTQFNGTGGPTLTIENQLGQTTTATLPPTDTSSNGQNERIEESLDVEWAHAIAPKANIIVLEANSLFSTDLFAAVNTARNTANVNVVSMSFGAADFPGETQYDQLFTTPAGHTGGGITFVAATGDFGTPEYPALSPNVVAVGGTALTLSGTGTFGSEAYWNSGGGAGGAGVSYADARSGAQSLAISSPPGRYVPDVSMDAQQIQSPDDYKNGVVVYDSYDGQSTPYYPGVGGTSLSAPMFAGIVALADQQRGSGQSLDGVTQTLPALYQAYSNATVDAADFHAISGSNLYSATTGIGSPIASGLVPTLKNYAPSLTFSGIESTALTDTAGASPIQLTSAIAVSDTNSIIGAVVGIPNDQGIHQTNNTYLSSDSVGFVSGYTLPTGITETVSFGYVPYSATNPLSGTGELTVVFVGSASAATYQTLLRSITFSTSSPNVWSSNRRIDFSVIDSTDASSSQSRNMTLTNTTPTITGLPGGSSTALPFNEMGPGTPVDPFGSTYYATINDSDSVYMSGARVVISVNYASGDELLFTSPAGSGITGSFASGTLTLSGVATVGQYDAALNSVVFKNVIQNPSTSVRQISYYVTDSSGDASTFTAASYNYVSVSVETTLPTITEPNPTPYTFYTQNGSPVTITNDLTVAVGSGSSTITSATAQITGDFVPGSDILSYSGTVTGITASYNATTGILILSGSATAAQYATALDSIQYSSTSDNPNDSSSGVTGGPVRPITFQVDDGAAWSNVGLGNSIKYVWVNTASSTPTLTVTGTSSNYSVSGNSISNQLSIINTSGTNSIVDSAANSMGTLTVTIGNYTSGDVLTVSSALLASSGVSAVFEYGKLTIFGITSKSNYVALLDSIKFYTTTGVSGSTRTFSFQMTDDTAAASASNTVVTTVHLVA